MKAKALQIWGTGSNVGKSVIATALCRIFSQEGYRVCPFKAQNMSLNSFVTAEGAEIGRAQAEQAYAAGILPDKDINPILIKPSSDTKAQIILQGRPIGNMSAVEYAKNKYTLFKKVKESYGRLSKKYELIIVEGAGSPAEINLKAHDIVNLKMAEYADADVILVGDIDKGGVFASLIGTMELLTQKERDRVKGFIINKFRGDKRLLKNGLVYLSKRTRKNVLGVLPYFNDINILQEDSACLKLHGSNDLVKGSAIIDIAVVRLPHISNFTDFNALENEPLVNLSYIDNPEELNAADIVILPGTKNTIGDLGWLRRSGMAKKILGTQYSLRNTILIGICGGFQMLGREINDPHTIESPVKKTAGLGFFDMATTLARRKQTCQVKGMDLISGEEAVSGYEIHHGKTMLHRNLKPRFMIKERAGRKVNILDGAVNANGRIWGTYIHGIFDNGSFRRSFISNVMALKNKNDKKLKYKELSYKKEFDKLADLFRKNIDMDYLYKLVSVKG